MANKAKEAPQKTVAQLEKELLDAISTAGAEHIAALEALEKRIDKKLAKFYSAGAAKKKAVKVTSYKDEQGNEYAISIPAHKQINLPGFGVNIIGSFVKNHNAMAKLIAMKFNGITPKN